MGAKELYDELSPLLIEPVKGPGDNLASFCPIHEGNGKHKRRSLLLSPSKGLTCFAGCEFEDILAALRGRNGHSPTLRERIEAAAPAPKADPSGRKLVDTYEYKSADGTLVAIKARFEFDDGHKEFKWKLPNKDWKDGISPLTMKDIPVWGAEYLARQLVTKDRISELVYICEGEKATKACRNHNMVAVCLPGSSSAKEFGENQLECFRNRNVVLWPDNDPPGRLYMGRLQVALKGIAKTISVIDVPLREKGDAADYFADGGTVEAIQKGVLIEPSVEYISDDSIRVRYPAALGVLTCTFSELERTSRALEAEFSLVAGSTDSGGGREDDVYSQRLNLMSASQVTELRRSLQEVYGKEWEWAKVLNAIISMVRKSFTERDPSIDLLDIPNDPDNQPMLVDPLIPDGSATTFFGDGGSAKSYIIMRLISSLSWGTSFLDMNIPCLPVLYVDYEDNEKTFRHRMERIAAGMGMDSLPPLVHYWPAKGIPLPDLAYALRRKVEKDGIGVMVVDSVAPACGGKPEDAEVALRYFRALQRIGVTTINIAHITKGGSTDYPFGSVFWNNESRKTWYVKRVQEEDSDDIDVAMFNRKVNEGPRSRPVGVAIHFDGHKGPVTFDLSPLAELEELQQERLLKDRISELLLHHPMTARQIAEKLGGKLTEKVVDKTLRSNAKLFVKAGAIPAGASGGRPSTLWGKKVPDYYTDSFPPGG